MDSQYLFENNEATLKAVINDPTKLKKVKNPSEDFLIKAVTGNFHVLKLIDNPSKKVIDAALKANPRAIKYVTKHEAEVDESSLIATVKARPQALKDIPNPTENVKLVAVSHDGMMIQYIEDPSQDVQIAACEQNGMAIQFIKNPVKSARAHAVVENPESIKFIKNPTEQEMIVAVKAKPRVLQYFENPPEKVQIAAVEEDANAIAGLKNPSEAIQLAAVNRDPSVVADIEKSNVTEKVLRTAIKKRPSLIRMHYFEDASEELKTLAVSLEPDVVIDLKNPSKELRKIALSKNPNLIARLENTDEDEWEVALKGNPRLGKRSDRPKSERLDRMISKAAKFSPEHAGNRVHLPRGISPDQMAVLRFMQKNKLEKISVQDLKKNFANTPVIQNLAKMNNGKPLTIDDVKSYGDENQEVNSEDIMSVVKHNFQVHSGGVWNGAQRAFVDHKNEVFLLTVKWDLVKDFFTKTAQKRLRTMMVGEYGHPTTFKNGYLTLAWIRYTIFGKDVWIDELQSDPAQDRVTGAMAAELKDICALTLQEFIRQFRKRGYQKFFMPTHDMKKKLYHANPPISNYKDIPKKMRFKMGKVEGIDDKVDGQEAWILEGIKATFKDFLVENNNGTI